MKKVPTAKEVQKWGHLARFVKSQFGHSCDRQGKEHVKIAVVSSQHSPTTLLYPSECTKNFKSIGNRLVGKISCQMYFIGTSDFFSNFNKISIHTFIEYFRPLNQRAIFISPHVCVQSFQEAILLKFQVNRTISSRDIKKIVKQCIKNSGVFYMSRLCHALFVCL